MYGWLERAIPQGRRGYPPRGVALSDTDVGKISIVRNGDSFAQTNVAQRLETPLADPSGFTT